MANIAATDAAGFKALTLANKPFALIAAMMALFAFFAPQSAFSVDDIAYIEMARAMADHGEFAIADEDAPPDAPALRRALAVVQIVDGKVLPQYPGGYALIAAPFYKLFGIHGLILMNALAGAASIFLLYGISLCLYPDKAIAKNAALIFAFATLLPSYVFGIWPHAVSLVFILAGAFFTAKAPQHAGVRRIFCALAAGFLFGLGLNFRLDVIVPAAAAFFWLRLFALPGDRLSALALIAGLLPSLVMASYINEIKFGVFLPFFYGEKDGLDSAGAYAPLAFAGLGVMAAVMVLDVSQGWVRRAMGAPLAAKAAVVLAAAGLAFVVMGDEILRLLRGVYFLVADMQAYDGSSPQMGVFRDAYGHWSFWGLPKKSLIQSMPFVALALLPLTEFFRGKNAASHAFSLLMTAGPIAFFSMKGFHGGMGFNLRYFLPCAPFLALLSACALSRFQPSIAAFPNIVPRSLIAGAFAAILLYQLAPTQSARYATLLQMYPQLTLFAALLLALVFYARKEDEKRRALIALAIAGVCLGYAATLNFSDMAGYLGLRAEKTPYEQAYKTAIAPGSLVITTAEDYLTLASLNGVHVARAVDGDEARLSAAIDAYSAAGRCVYAHSEGALQYLDEKRFEPVAVPGLADPDPAFALFALRGQDAHCRPGGGKS